MTSSDLIANKFSRHSTADDVILGIDLSGHRAVVTGASSGIGTETARALASAGAEVCLAVRNIQAGRQVATAIEEQTGNPNITVESLELADRASVRAFAERWRGPLHILVNNAGVMAEPLRRTAEGWEHQFATNYLGHFALSVGLHDALAEGAPARVVALTSSGHFYSPVVLDDLQFDRRPYDPWLAYGQSKTAIVLFAVEATRRWAADLYHRQRGDARRHPDQSAAAPVGPRMGGDRPQLRLEDGARRRRNVGVCSHLAAAGRHRWPILRELPASAGRGSQDRS